MKKKFKVTMEIATTRNWSARELKDYLHLLVEDEQVDEDDEVEILSSSVRGAGTLAVTLDEALDGKGV